MAGRITPAGAGKTEIAEGMKRGIVGSPPQVRGKRQYIPLTVGLSWITPAGAGKTITAAYAKILTKDHPRRCGENYLRSHVWIHAEGSPPQVRGKHFYGFISNCADRITPAGAGKTYYCLFRRYSFRDHPRRCGENSFFITSTNISLGSPPQVRGKLQSSLIRFSRCRITPAGAGKTFVYLYRFISFWDHPRRCGENLLGIPYSFQPSGSPPQVRGKHFRSLECAIYPRITPAGAGKTRS